MGIFSQGQTALLTNYDTSSAYSQAYHRLYTNIRLNWEPAKQHTLLLTTPTAYPGHAETSANVAIAAAQNGTPTILIEADFQASRLSQIFGLNKQIGLSDLLTSEALESQAKDPHLYLSKTSLPDLYLLSAGTKELQPHQASQLLSAKLPEMLAQIRQFLAKVEHRPSLIIVHSPSMATSTDSALISTLVEQTFLIIVSGHTTRTQTRRAQEQLQLAHAKLVGVILLDA